MLGVWLAEASCQKGLCACVAAWQQTKCSIYVCSFGINTLAASSDPPKQRITRCCDLCVLCCVVLQMLTPGGPTLRSCW